MENPENPNSEDDNTRASGVSTATQDTIGTVSEIIARTQGDGPSEVSSEDTTKSEATNPPRGGTDMMATSASYSAENPEGTKISVTIVPPAAVNPVETMSNAELVNAVNELQKNTRYLELENNVFMNFLQKNDPSLIEGMGTIIQYATQARERASISTRRTLTRRSTMRDSGSLWSGTPVSETPSATPVTEKEGPRINITQKTDLILREMEEIKTTLEAASKKFSVIKHKLKAELEEMAIRESDIRETTETFENVFILGTVEKYSQNKNPAEKFARFMEEWFKNTRLTVDKIRLRTSSLKVQYQKICNELTQKKLLGENLQEVDFEQLQIENKHLVLKIDQRNLLLLELKRMNGKANLLLSQNKKLLLKKIDEMQEIQSGIAFKEQGILKFDEECDKVSMELEKTKTEFDKIKMKTETYEVPEVLEYVKKKAELNVLKKNLKIWARRKQIKDMALVACIREMKHTTGQKKVNPQWFTVTDKDTYANTFTFPFEATLGLNTAASKKKRNTGHQTQKVISSKL